MKYINKLLCVLLSLILIMLAIQVPSLTFADVYDFDGDYEISSYYSITDLSIDEQDNIYIFSFTHEGNEIVVSSEFYKLLGAALFNGKAVGNVLNSNMDILYFAVSDEVGLLDNVEGVLSSEEILLSIVILDTVKGEISDINAVINIEEYPWIYTLFKQSKVINYDNDLYGELLHTQLWMKLYIPENVKASDDFIQMDVNSSTILPMGAADNSIIASFVTDANLKQPGHVHGYKYNTSGQPIGFYIRDTFKSGTSYLTLLAIFDISPEIAGSGTSRNVTFKVQRAYNYFVEMTSSNTKNVTEADNNSTYLVTKNPSIGLGLVGTQTEGYFNTCKVEASLGSSSSSTSEFLGDTIISLVGKKFPLISAVAGAVDFFGSAMNALSDAVYDATYNQFQLFSQVDPTKNVKTVSTIYENQMYKKFSLLKMYISIESFKSTSTSKINFQFRITTIGSQYNQNPTMNVNTTIDFNKPI